MVREQLEARGIDEPRVLSAFRSVPREAFVPPEYRDEAYCDRALPIRCDQTISQPFMVATMTQALAVEEGHRVLEVGTGSGYQTAILAAMGADVFTVERHRDLTDRARENLRLAGYGDHVRFRVGDGTRGWPEHAPYDRILVTAGAPAVPESLQNQTARPGRIVIPVGNRGGQTLQVLTRREDGSFTRQSSVSCVFVPLTGEEGWDPNGESRGFW